MATTKRAITGARAVKASYCIGCNTDRAVTNFYDSPNKFNEGRKTIYCKECGKQIGLYYLEKTKSLEASLYFTCAKFDVPFIRTVYEAFENRRNAMRMENELTTKKEYNHFGQYMSSFKQMNKDGKWKDFSDTDVALGDIMKLRKSEESIEKEIEALRLVWGKERAVDDIAFLEYRWDVYTTDKILTDYQESQYRNLCLAELDIFNDKDVDSAVKRQSQTAKVLGIDSFQVDKEKTLLERTLESQIFVIEQEEPAEHYEDLKMYADFMGIEKYWQNHVIRPIRNLLLNTKEYKILPEEEDSNEEV